MATGTSGLRQIEANRQQVWEVIFDNIRDENIREAAKEIGELLHSNKDSKLTTSGELDNTVAEALGKFNLNAEQHVKLAEVTALMLHTERASNYATAYNEPSINPLEDTIKKLAGGKESDPIRQIKDPEKRAQILKQFSDIAIDDVMTMHPTYVGTLEYTKQISELDTAIENRNPQAQNEIIKDILSKSPVISDNRTATEENKISLHFLENARESVPELYQKMDETLEKFGFTEDERWNFGLNITERSWGLGGGDKDGNSNIYASNMEEGIQMNRDKMHELYTRDFAKLAELDSNFRDSEAYATIQKNIDTIKGADIYKDQGSLADETKALIKNTLKNDVFLRDDASDEAKQLALDIKRTVHTLGLTMGRIELRETADVHEQVLNNVLPQHLTDNKKYSDLSDDQKLDVVNKAIKADPTMLKEWAKQAIENVPEESKNSYKEDKKNGNQGITHTALKRLQLAAANPDIIKGQVLAEAETPLQFKEMLLLLKATDNETNVRIVPLFEDPEILKDVGKITETMLKDKDYFQYLADISLNKWEGRANKGLEPALSADIKEGIRKLDPERITFKEDLQALNKTLVQDHNINLTDILKIETQLAHSDNTRRGGTSGAKGGIEQAHTDIRAVVSEFGFGAVFHEGGSHTDPVRMGTRSETDQINTYKNFDFVKSTIQGIDSIMMNNSVDRWVGRKLEVLTHCATKLGMDRNQLGERTLSGTPLKRALSGSGTDYINESLIEQVDKYQEKFFTDDRFGLVIAQLQEYKARTDDMNKGLRAAGRSGGGKDETANFLDPVNGTRTIGFTQAGIYSEDNPGYLGAGELRESLLKAFDAKYEDLKSGDTIGDREHLRAVQGLKRDEEKLNFMYMNSSALRSAIDPGAAYGTAASNMDSLWKKAMQHSDGTPRDIVVGEQRVVGDKKIGKKEFVQTGTERITERPKPRELEDMSKEGTVRGFLALKEIEYRKAAELAVNAITGNKLDISDDQSTASLLPKVRDALPDYKARLEQQDVAISISRYQRDAIGDEMTPESSRTITSMIQHAVMSAAMSQKGKIMRGIAAEQEKEQGR